MGEDPLVRRGEIYTVSAVLPADGYQSYGISLAEVVIPRDRAPYWYREGWVAHRFRPIVEKKTDISFAHEILRRVTRKDRVRA